LPILAGFDIGSKFREPLVRNFGEGEAQNQRSTGSGFVSFCWGEESEANYFKSFKQLSGFMKDPTGTWVITRVPVNVKRVFDFAYNLGSKVSQNDQVSLKNRRFY
jgi:hypothetical protein